MTDEYQHPAEGLAEDAAEAMRGLIHATLIADQVNQPSVIYRVTGDLYTLAARLDQALGQLARALEHQLATGELEVAAGAPFEADPAAAVASAVSELAAAQQATSAAYKALAAAQEAISGLYRAGE